MKSWFSPASIVIGDIALVDISLLWRRRYRREYQGAHEVSTKDLDDVLETRPSGIASVPPFLVFLTVIAYCARPRAFGLSYFPR